MTPVSRMRALTAIAAVAVLGVAYGATYDDRAPGFPLHLVGQGVQSLTIDGETAFVIRDGSVVTVFGKTTPGTGSALVYCPREEFFVAPDDGALYDRDGQYVDGPGTHDMTKYKHIVNRLGMVRISDPQQLPRSVGEISGEAAEAYRNWQAEPDKPQGFCRGPVR